MFLSRFVSNRKIFLNCRNVLSKIIRNESFYINFLIVLYLLGLQNIYSQNTDYKFQYITSDNGLSQNSIDCIYKDSRGFMWFGTWNGLNRFDGYGFQYYKTGSGNCISSDYVYSICEDQEGNLWIGTENGLNKFNFSLNQFTVFYHDSNDNNSLSASKINEVVCDKQGVIWVGTGQGINRILKNKNGKYIITRFKNNSNQPGSLSDNLVNTLYVDRNDNLWVGTGLGLNKLNRKTGTFTTYFYNPNDNNSLSHNAVMWICEDRYGFMWIGTWNGLNRFDRSKGKFYRYHYNPNDKNSISNPIIRAIEEDNDGNLLIGTLDGLNRYNRKTDDFYRFNLNKIDDYSLNSELINCIKSDNQGNVWIGTDKGGINMYNINQKQFGRISHDLINKNSINSNTINSVFYETDNLWIGTAGSGLNRLDLKTGKYYHYVYSSTNSNSISDNFISSIKRDCNGNLWVSTWGNGLNRMVSTSGNGVFERIISTGKPGSINNVFVSSFWFEDDMILIGGLNGIELMYSSKKTFKRLAYRKDWKNKISNVQCMYKDSRGYYWIGNRDGLYRFHSNKLKDTLKDNDITCYTRVTGNNNSLPGNYIISICEDKIGNIWVGTFGSGICKLQIKGNNVVKFTRFNEQNGLSNNVVYSILVDNRGKLWMSTDFGLSNFDPDKLTFENFYTSDGLSSNQFYWSAGCKSIDGQMFFGGVKGLIYFKPENIFKDTMMPKVTITNFKIFNNSVNIGTWNNKKTILERSISETSEIKISYKENVFSFEFSALSYSYPEKIKYAYKMLGVDADWVIVPSSQRFATYTNLKGGEYTFYVKATNSSGVWSNKITKLDIIITPPFWKTIGFKIFVILILIFAVILFVKYRTRLLTIQKKRLEVLVNERTIEIEEQKRQLEAQNKEISEQRDKLIELNKHVQQANQIKLQFFTNISHEFRTPLTLILGPIDRLLKYFKGNEQSFQDLLLINRNAQRLLHLINQLLDFRKVETNNLGLDISKGDLIGFVNEIYLSFKHLAEQKKIKYTFHANPCDEEQWFDPEKLENILYNLLSNAFKFTPQNGNINLTLTFINNQDNAKTNVAGGIKKNLKNASWVEIVVQDTGIGISQEHIKSIFKRFYQVNKHENTKIKGSGIGLSLVKELVLAYHGQINVESEINKGSIFTVKLPYNKDEFKTTEITTEQLNYKKRFDAQHVANIFEIETNEDRQNSKKTKPTTKTESPKPLILIVEDNADLRAYISSCLQNIFETIEAENGAEAYELTKRHNPALIISDIMMPEMDGFEFCSRIKNNILTSHIPIILLTAKSSVENQIEGIEIGADDYISKPFDINYVIARIKNLLDSRKKLKIHFSGESIPDASLIAKTSTDVQFLEKAFQIVEENYMNSSFGVEEFIDKMCISRSLLHKKLSALTNQSAGDFILSIRLKKAAHLLRTSNGNIYEIAANVGFNDSKYFSRLFKRYFGSLPSDYMKTLR